MTILGTLLALIVLGAIMEPELTILGTLLALIVLGAVVQLLRESQKPFIMVGALVIGSLFLMVGMDNMVASQAPVRTEAVPPGATISERHM